MQKGFSLLCFLALSVPALANDELPAALTEYYQPAQNEFQNRVWSKRDNPDLEYSLCLDKKTTLEQRIAVMCGNVVDASEPDSGSFDIWYLEGEKITVRGTTEGYGRMGISGEAHAVKIGANWGVMLESGYMLQGVKQTFQQFYLADGKNIKLIASLPTHSNSGEEDHPKDNLFTQVAFAKTSHDGLPNMLLHSTGTLSGEKIDKRWSVPFDLKVNQYPIPEEINIGY